MVKRKWSVPVVSEFYPADPRLLGLNINAGQAIRIRLRRPSSRAAFFPFEAILHTLLHELAHIERGPHDAAFYRLLDELVAEAERLPARGASGSPADVGAGRRLDGARAVPRRQAASAAARAAERRQQKQGIMGSGRLGGDAHGLAAVCSPAELAVAAAERRRKDDVWCPSGVAPSGSATLADGERKAGSEQYVTTDEGVVVLDSDDGDGAEAPSSTAQDASADVIVID